jgi:predicted kinase
MVGAGVYRFEPGKLEDMIRAMAHASIAVLLCAGDVIIDETSLTVAKRAELIAIARESNAVPVIVWCKEGNLEECLNRRMKDDPRGYDRGKWEEVIRGMQGIFEPPTSEECEVMEVV